MIRYPIQNLTRRTLGQAPPPGAPPAPAVPPCCRVYWNPEGMWYMACSDGGQRYYEGPVDPVSLGDWAACMPGAPPQAAAPAPPPGPLPMAPQNPPPVGLPQPPPVQVPAPGGIPTSPFPQGPAIPPPGLPQPPPSQGMPPSGFIQPPGGIPVGGMPPSGFIQSPVRVPPGGMPVGIPERGPKAPIAARPIQAPAEACPLGPVPLAKWIQSCPGFRNR